MPKENYEDDYDIVLTKQKPSGKGKSVEQNRKKGGNKKDKPIYNSKYVRTKINNLDKTNK